MSDDITPAADDASPSPRPTLRIVRGNPDDVDIAVITAVLSSAGGSAPEEAPVERDRWGAPEEKLRPAWNSAPTGFYNMRWAH